MEPVRTDYAAGNAHLIASMVSNYQCGSCGGQVEELLTDNTTGFIQANIHHDDNCPVLNGHVSSIDDFARAAVIPDTFKARP
ncbi:hypothetical protein [Streptomyces sp. NBC_00258]|uniref:hypothetical protein n=1 Tax=Streptomyces sp. NBC_00258 TaxID=2903642 RepID=UPI002E2D0168|nr:hypothetical protein [Streptomyces sp. NBC_00258]